MFVFFFLTIRVFPVRIDVKKGLESDGDQRQARERGRKEHGSELVQNACVLSGTRECHNVVGGPSEYDISG